MALIVILGLPVVLVGIFVVVGNIRDGQASALPDLRTKGLQWAKARGEDAGFSTVNTHDALGRNRGNRDAKSWQVCFQSPTAGNHPRKTPVELGVVRVTETCPTTDQWQIAPATSTMPDLINRTAFIASKALGDDASIRYVDVASRREISRDLGDFRVCAQEPAAGEPFDGVPVKAAVVPYDDDCRSPKGVPSDTLDALQPAALLARVLDSLPG
jgi:beta-lactam-binding protein with PASTA domain